MEDREVACGDVDLGDRLAVDGHFKPLFLFQPLIAVVTLAVEPAALIPLKPVAVAAVEDTPVPSMGASEQFVLIDELVEFSYFGLKCLGLRCWLEPDLSARHLLPSSSVRRFFEHQGVRWE